jgi:tartronate-semialdehyde synthase
MDNPRDIISIAQYGMDFLQSVIDLATDNEQLTRSVAKLEAERKELIKKALAVMGDFGFTFMVEELAAAATYKAPVIVVILNIAYLSLIRQNQKYAYQYEYAVSMKENHTMMDYVKVAEGLGCNGERVFRPEQIPEALVRAYESATPYVIDIIVEENTDCSMGPNIAAVREFE